MAVMATRRDSRVGMTNGILQLVICSYCNWRGRFNLVTLVTIEWIVRLFSLTDLSNLFQK